MGIYYINRLIARGPEGGMAEPEGLPSRPLSGARDAVSEAPVPTRG
jgi:hypothetical protein